MEFGRRLFAQVSDLGSADHLVTGTTPPRELPDALAEQQAELITPESRRHS